MVHSKPKTIELYITRAGTGQRGRLNAWSGENAAWMGDPVPERSNALRAKLLQHAHRAVMAWQSVFPHDKIEMTGG
jgi:hypothetical protein